MSDEMFKDLFLSSPFGYGGLGDSETGLDEYESLARAFELSSDYSNEISGTPMNSSASFSSSDAGADEDDSLKEKDKQIKDMDDGGESSKTAAKSKKKVDKKEREPRVAFMTKSEVDHLEDGYRWRKYGQKAVKNSAYPRSYYRCTTQKCGVKKRVERSYEDPSIVITTYEGQHNHPIPATLRGNLSAASGAFQPSMLAPMPVVGGVRYLPQLMNNTSVNNNQAVGGGDSVYSQSSSFNYPYNGRQQDYGLLQDIFPTAPPFLNRQP
ncbi:probable WRKY transcription factor 71 [Cucurbita maxima]|uniref:Probable WRKY transcription factor 71 n=1 Tax=Cucurbita maxima TaxID=3661 RepID=A0A6J1IR95_CUCMA|nr:probable WRKY transcription factor 71 [Cucurbita maxima]